MKIGIVSKADASGGGASRVADDLTRILFAHGHDVVHFVSWPSRDGRDRRRTVNGILNMPLRVANYALKKVGFPETVPFELPYLLSVLKRERFDLLHFHDISSAYSPLTMEYLSRIVPVVWTFHDCSPFTAGCLYPMDCDRYRVGCGCCPQIGRWPIDCYIDNTRCLHRIKRHVHRKGRIFPLSPSQWMSDMAVASGIVTIPPRIVPNCVDTHVFRRMNKQIARDVLEIDPERWCLLLSAGSLLDERKGMMFAIDAIRRVTARKPYVIIAGHFPDANAGLLRGLDYRSLGHISDRDRMNMVYSAADLFVFPSVADNQPLAVLEAMASGTPVVGFATGGLPEMVQNNVNGMLVPRKNVQALAEALEFAASTEASRAWGFRARRDVEQQFSEQVFYENHMVVYRELSSTK